MRYHTFLLKVTMREGIYKHMTDKLGFALATEEELVVRKSLVKYWTNFAKYKHPTPSIEEGVTQWLPYSSEKVCFIC